MATYDLPAKQENTQSPSLLEPSLPSEEYTVQAMPSILNTVDMTASYMMTIFFIANAATAATGGAVALLYWVVSAITFFIPCAVVTAQLGVMFPYEGSIYNWVHKGLGKYWSFFAGLCYWIPGILVIVAASTNFVGYIQGLNNNWLAEPWQQGVVILALVVFSGVLSVQRYRTVQHIVNVAVGLILLAVLLIALSGVVWLVTGHASATRFDQPLNWKMSSDNYGLFGLIALAYLGTTVPSNMGGEIAGVGGKKGANTVKGHLLWGTLLVIVCYLVTTASLLIVRGAAVNSATVLPFELITVVNVALGKFAASITAVCILSFFVVVPAFFNYSFARLLFVSSVDQRLPLIMGKLNRNRVPANAVILQTILMSIFTIVIFMITPYVVHLGKPIDLTTQVYNVILASITLLWTFITIPLLLTPIRLYLRDKQAFAQKRIVPMPVLWFCVVIGIIACVIIIADTLRYSWIEMLISSGSWWFIVGGLTLVSLVVAGIGSMVATSEAEWENTIK